MEIAKRNRSDLKSYFQKNSIPTQEQFAELIDGVLNQKDDAVVKPSKADPLCIEAAGDAASAKKTISFYENFQDPNPAWSLQLKAAADPAPKGFAINDGAGATRLFIDAATGNLGIGTVTPGEVLEVQGNAKIAGQLNAAGDILLGGPTPGQRFILHATPDGRGDFLQFTYDYLDDKEGGVGWDWNQGISLVRYSGNVGIGTVTPSERLEINGNLKVGGSVGVSGSLKVGEAPASVPPAAPGRARPMGVTSLKPSLHVLGKLLIDDGSDAGAADFMMPGSLTLGSITASYGGGNKPWDEKRRGVYNAAGLLLQTRANTEIAVHDAGERLASLMFYEGDGGNRITIGRDMGWGAIGSIALSGQVFVHGSRLYPKIKVYRDLVVVNKGIDAEGTWEVKLEGDFIEVYQCFVMFQGYTLWPNFDPGPGHHLANAIAIAQLVYVKLTDFNNFKAWGVGYCSEAGAAGEVDNRLMFTLVAIGADKG